MVFRGLCFGRELRSWYGGDHASGVIGIWHCHTPTCKQIKNGDFVGAMCFCDVVVHDVRERERRERGDGEAPVDAKVVLGSDDFHSRAPRLRDRRAVRALVRGAK